MAKRLKSSEPGEIADWVNESLDDMRDQLIAHIDDVMEEHKTLLKSAFIDGDPVLHRIAHDTMKTNADNMSETKRTLIKNSIWGLIVGGFLLNWEAIKIGIKLWFK